MEPAGEVDPRRLDGFRPYLRLLTRLHWDDRLNGKLDPEDLVQETLAEAHKSLAQFRGGCDAEFARWLAGILAHRWSHLRRRFAQEMRDLDREVALDALEKSSARLDAWLAAEQSSPSECADRNERAVRLAAALEQLPEAQREAVVLRHMKGWSVAAIARHLDRSTPAVAGLLKRGLQQLRSALGDLQ
jgi:RNA polymerase sigma-70 factor (ECF subfamily)